MHTTIRLIGKLVAASDDGYLFSIDVYEKLSIDKDKATSVGKEYRLRTGELVCRENDGSFRDIQNGMRLTPTKDAMH